jgi:hypothetical protein
MRRRTRLSGVRLYMERCKAVDLASWSPEDVLSRFACQRYPKTLEFVRSIPMFQFVRIAGKGKAALVDGHWARYQSVAGVLEAVDNKGYVERRDSCR